MRGKKRVRFKVSGADHSSVSNCDGTSIPSGSADASGLADPKTSEFAFFKKLKRDASKKFHPYDQHTETKQFKNCKSTNNVGDMSIMKYGNFKSMPHAKEAVPADPILLPSPQASAFCSTDKTRELANCLAFQPSSARNSPVGDHLHSPISSYFDRGVTEGTKHKGGDIFSMKRQNLQKRIAQTWFPKNHELLKGYDLVSVLLRRLLPESTQNMDSLYGQFTAKSKCQSVTYPNSSALLYGNYGPSRNFDTAESFWFLDDDSSVPCSIAFRETSTSALIDEDFDTCQVESGDRMLIRYDKQEPQSGYALNDCDSFWSKSFKNQASSTWLIESYGSVAAGETRAIIPQYETAECKFANDANFSYWPQKSEDSILIIRNLFEEDSNPSTVTCSYGSLLEDNRSIEDCDFDCDAALRLNTWSYPHYDISSKKYITYASISSEEKNESTLLKTYEIGEQPSTLYLSWDAEAPKNMESFPRRDALNLDFVPLPLTPYSNDTRNSFERAALYRSSSYSSLVPDFLVHQHSSIYEDGSLKTGDDEDRSFMSERSYYGTLPFTYAPRQIYLTGSGSTEEIFGSTNCFLLEDQKCGIEHLHDKTPARKSFHL
ncbi:hypothetical protein Drorol1_Dr00018925 [Drosera rotundifolia]